jgi:hypothetical protein
MGGEQIIERLSTFLSSPAEFALDTFVSECVMPPTVVAPASRDPQMKQITDALCVAETRSIRVIDWGAGRGRLAATMRERQGISSENLARSVEYFAYDTSAVHREECCSAMQGLVPDPAFNYFEEVSRLVAHFDVRKADVVTMCNVLHEIEPLEWTRILAEEVPSVVCDEGYLLIAEDLGMPHGEHANSHGFLVLDEVGIRRLFVDKDSKITVCRSPEERYKHRLITYLVPRQLLLNVRTQSVAAAAKWVYDNARRRIREIRQTGAVSHRSGRELAFQLAQFANSSLVLQSMGEEMESHSTAVGDLRVRPTCGSD